MYGTSQVSVPLDLTLQALTRAMLALVTAQLRQADYLSIDELKELTLAKKALVEVLEWES